MRDGNQDPEPESARSPNLAADCTRLSCASPAFAELTAEILRSGAALRFQARGTSMAPLVRDGDRILVRPEDPGSVQVGDVVLCNVAPGRVVAHRVIRKEPGPESMCFTVQGDQVAMPDGSIPAAQVLGRVAAIERAGVCIDLDRPVTRLLGRLAAIWSRWGLGRSRGLRLASRGIKRLPGLAKYLA